MRRKRSKSSSEVEGKPVHSWERVVVAGLCVTGLVILLFRTYSSPPSSTNRAVTEMSAGDVGKIISHTTHLGEVSVRIIGENTPDKIPVICLSGINPGLKDEWVHVGQYLSERGYRVSIIDFHSNPMTKPAMIFGGISDLDVQKIISDSLIKNLFNTKKAVILGKSWGGRQAALFASTNPAMVIKLGIICPASSGQSMIESVRESGLETFLAWARDDMVTWHRNTETWTRILGPSITFYSAMEGGHRILDEYIDPIFQFLVRDGA
jgi:pimeloyl-ACP methyl ester carboxylesterase